MKAVKQMQTDLERQAAEREQRLFTEVATIQKDGAGTALLSDLDLRLEENTTSLRLQLQGLAETLALSSDSAKLLQMEQMAARITEETAAASAALDERIAQVAHNQDFLRNTISDLQDEIASIKEIHELRLQGLEAGAQICRTECGARHEEVKSEVESMFKGEMRVLQRLADMEKRLERHTDEVEMYLDRTGADQGNAAASVHGKRAHRQELDNLSGGLHGRIADIEVSIEKLTALQFRLEEVGSMAEHGATVSKRLDAFQLQVGWFSSPQGDKAYKYVRACNMRLQSSTFCLSVCIPRTFAK
jgi:hypothetical protein